MKQNINIVGFALKFLSKCTKAKLFNLWKYHIFGYMDRDVFIHGVKQVLAERGLTPHPEILDAIPSTMDEMRAAINNPTFAGDKSIFEVPTREQVGFAAKYYPQIKEIVMEIARANPEIAREKWKGNVAVPQGTAGKMEQLANQVGKDKSLASITNTGLWAKSIRTIKKPARANVWKATADNVMGFFQYMDIFHKDYERRAGELAGAVAIRKMFRHLSAHGRVSGPLSALEGYQFYCKIVECNPSMKAHFEEIEIARGIRKANIWHAINQEKQRAAAKKEAAAKLPKPRKIKAGPRR